MPRAKDACGYRACRMPCYPFTYLFLSLLFYDWPRALLMHATGWGVLGASREYVLHPEMMDREWLVCVNKDAKVKEDGWTMEQVRSFSPQKVTYSSPGNFGSRDKETIIFLSGVTNDDITLNSSSDSTYSFEQHGRLIPKPFVSSTDRPRDRQRIGGEAGAVLCLFYQFCYSFWYRWFCYPYSKWHRYNPVSPHQQYTSCRFWHKTWPSLPRYLTLSRYLLTQQWVMTPFFHLHFGMESDFRPRLHRKMSDT